MNRTVHVKGETLRLDVYSSRLYLRRILHPKDGDVGYAIIRNKEVTLSWSGQYQMWCRPGFMLMISQPIPPYRSEISA